ncbi:MarR family transcriptional regulator [Planctomycetaceae bacterium SCGC AG-212-D15]|nr:MarR family transcriptional regulator [Planctomycetaceae bacterium SCGC AG-212-D15]
MPSKLQRELKKRGPFATLAQEVILNLARTSDQLVIRAERLLREHGLTGSQYNVLRILRGEGKPLPILEIGSRMIQIVPGITGLIDRLESAEFVRRERSTEDRRVIFISITKKALEVLAALDQPLIDLEEKLVQCLSVAEQRELIRVLEKVREHLDQIGG